MKMEDFFRTIELSSPGDWLKVERRVNVTDIGGTAGGWEIPWAHSDKPHTHFVYRNDLSIGIAKGRQHSQAVKDVWCSNFGRSCPCSSWIDFLYNGALIHCCLYVAVDRGRCCLPKPGLSTLEVSRRHHDVLRLLHSIDDSSGSSFEDYFERSGLMIKDSLWP